MSRELTSLQTMLDSLNRRPGVVVGPGLTIVPGEWERIVMDSANGMSLGESMPPPNAANIGQVVDLLTERNPAEAKELVMHIRKELQSLSAPLDLAHIARGGWSACLSLTVDGLFETAIRSIVDALPSSRTVTIVDEPSIQLPTRTIPVYELLGNVDADHPGRAIALAESEITLRKQLWPRLLRTLPDYLKDAPLIFLGTHASVQHVRDLLGTLHAMQRPNVSRVIFLKDDPTLNDATVRALGREIGLQVVDASVREVSAAIAELKPKQARVQLVSAPAGNSRLDTVFQTHRHLVSVVPNAVPADYDPNHHLAALTDSLFRPTAIDWMPYLLEYELPRAIRPELIDSIRAASGGPEHRPYIVVHGEAAVGKTTILKSVSCALAKEGSIVLWCKRVASGNWLRQYRSLAQDLTKAVATANEERPIVLVCDDPWALRLDAGELLSCFAPYPGRIVFVFAFRNSDYWTSDGPSHSLPLRPYAEKQLPFELDSVEINELAQMLVRIGAAKDAAEAGRIVSDIPSANANDILCSLWYVVPETQSQLSESLRDEYFRLGAVEDTIAHMARNLASSSQVARHAYECVSVASAFDLDLPLEVLVRTLGIDYGEWFSMRTEGRPLWGLLYEDSDPEKETIVFRTRNEIVTRVLLELVNQGVGHAGEVRVLEDLLRACDVGSPMYRNFVLDLLVRTRPKLARRLSYEQGMKLYQTARETLPHEDRVIEHHMGIWMQDVGKKPRQAYEQFEKALASPKYPGADRDAPSEHIHTSMAASIVQLVREGEQDPASGLEAVRDHLRQATSPSFFNPHTAHVAANILFQLSQIETTNRVALPSLAEALQEIEKAMQLIGAHGRNEARFEKDIYLLTELHRKILESVPEVDRLREIANDLFDRIGSQDGFEVVARKMLAEAIASNKGRAFNKVMEYLSDCVKKIESAGQEPAVELIAVRVDLMIRWRVQRVGGAIDWQAFKADLEDVMRSIRFRDSVEKMFYHAVAQYHCGDTVGATATFASLRRLRPFALMPNEIRCYLLSKEGSPKRLQCTINQQGQRWYAEIPELRVDVPVRSPPAEGGPGATGHAYLGFTLNGPLAIFRRPESRSFTLADTPA